MPHSFPTRRSSELGHVRYTPGDARIDRRVMSPGAAWIVRTMLEANPRPGERADTFDRSGRPRVAWKTGTSYGFRAAWALGGTRRHPDLPSVGWVMTVSVRVQLRVCRTLKKKTKTH